MPENVTFICIKGIRMKETKQSLSDLWALLRNKEEQLQNDLIIKHNKDVMKIEMNLYIARRPLDTLNFEHIHIDITHTYTTTLRGDTH